MGTTKDIRAAVLAELAFDPLVDATDITVKNMNGEVGLTGTAPSYPHYLQAAAAAQRVSRNALLEDDSDVRVDTTGNTVTLGGHVRTWAEHDAVVGATWMAPGVLQVRDYLDITG